MLLVRPLPHSGESRQAYLLRLAEANALESPLLLSGELIGTSGLLDGLCSLRGPVVALPALAASDHGGLSSRYWNTRSARFCPLCIRAREFWPAVWQLAFYVTCHVHGCSMVETCTRCGKLASWRRAQLGACRCGAELAHAKAQKATRVECGLAASLATAFESVGAVRQDACESLHRRWWLLGSYSLARSRKAQKLPSQ